MHFSRRGQLCTGRRACWGAPKLPVHILEANADLPRPYAILLSLVCLLVPAAVLYTASKRQATPSAAAVAAPSGGGGGASSRIARVASGLLRFAGQPWFPWVAGLATAINLFTIVFTAATVVLFLGAVLGRPKRWRSTAVANALGATAGSAVLLLLLRQRGEGLLVEQFPAVLASPAWAKTTAIMQRYGVAGMVLVASLPLILHPVIAFGILSGASDASILGIVLGGRTLKYLVMAYVTAHAPHALRYFGVKQSLFDMAQAAATGRGNAPLPPEGWRNCDEMPGALVRTSLPPQVLEPLKAQPATAPVPEPAPTLEPVPATETAPAPVPRAAAEETKANGPTTAATGPGPKGGEAEPTSAAVVEPPRSESLGKQGKKKSSMGALFSALTPRSRRGSNDK